MLVYLADLRHKTITLTPDAMPLGIGYLAAYGTKVFGNEVQFKLFADTELLLEELRHTKPAVLGVTNYCWNYAVHCRVLRYARGLYPDVLTVMGGPNISLDHRSEEARLRQTPSLDLYVINEGEEAFVRVLGRYFDSGLRKDRTLREPLPSSIFVDPGSGQVVRGAPTLRMGQLADIPSPYLTGLMDPFFDGKFTPMIQTNRGCPFTCTFCVEGVSYMTKVNKFGTDRVRDELSYISQRVGIGSALMISDSNFGMLPGDLDTARAIQKLQHDISWPRFVWATTGKNNKEAILSAIELLGGSMIMGNSVQSMDTAVLQNIKRSNIKLETYNAVLQEVRARNLQSYAEVIIGLPGETKEGFFRGVARLLDSGVQRVCAYQLMLLDGTELCDQATRGKYGFQTKVRMLSRNFGVYADEPVFETEEIVVSTNTFSFEDYMECRKLQLIMEVYHREELFRELLEYLRTRQVPISEYIFDLLNSLPEAPEGAAALFADYLREAQNELFGSAEAARQALAGNYNSLLEEEAGGNLVQKYSAIAWFKTLEPVLDYGIQRARALVLTRTGQHPDTAAIVDRELETIRRYLLAKTINLIDILDRSDDVVVPLAYDVEGWRAAGYQQPLSDFRHHPSHANGADGGEAIPYRFYVSEAHAAYLRGALSAHGTSSQALGKLMSRVAIRDLRRQVEIARRDTSELRASLG